MKDKLKPNKPGDTINHPAHYNLSPAHCLGCGTPIECIDVVEHMEFNLGNAMKYIWRAGMKDGTSGIQDLEKAAWYIRREIELLERKK